MLRTYTIEIVADTRDGKELRIDIDLRDRDDQIATERGFSFVNPVIGMSRRTLKYGFEYLGLVDMVDGRLVDFAPQEKDTARAGTPDNQRN